MHRQFPQQRLDLVPRRSKHLPAKEVARQGVEAKVAVDKEVVGAEVGGQQLLPTNPTRRKQRRKNHQPDAADSIKDMGKKHFIVCSQQSALGSSISMIRSKISEVLARLGKLVQTCFHYWWMTLTMTRGYILIFQI